jgi:peptide/nickel transport system permease protein
MMRLWLPAGVLALWGLLAVSVWVLPLTPNLIHLEHILTPPGSGAWLGYDDLGRNIGERLLVGARTSFLVAVWSAPSVPIRAGGGTG